jgi:Novel toxin 21
VSRLDGVGHFVLKRMFGTYEWSLEAGVRPSDRTGHAGDMFKGASFNEPFQVTTDAGRDGTYDLDVDSGRNVNGLKWVAK